MRSQGLLVGSVHISDVHILELHLGILAFVASQASGKTPKSTTGSRTDRVPKLGADQVYEFPGALHWHHQGPMLHRLRTKQAHLGKKGRGGRWQRFHASL